MEPYTQVMRTQKSKDYQMTQKSRYVKWFLNCSWQQMKNVKIKQDFVFAMRKLHLPMYNTFFLTNKIKHKQFYSWQKEFKPLLTAKIGSRTRALFLHDTLSRKKLQQHLYSIYVRGILQLPLKLHVLVYGKYLVYVKFQVQDGSFTWNPHSSVPVISDVNVEIPRGNVGILLIFLI